MPELIFSTTIGKPVPPVSAEKRIIYFTSIDVTKEINILDFLTGVVTSVLTSFKISAHTFVKYL